MMNRNNEICDQKNGENRKILNVPKYIKLKNKIEWSKGKDYKVVCDSEESI